MPRKLRHWNDCFFAFLDAHPEGAGCPWDSVADFLKRPFPCTLQQLVPWQRTACAWARQEGLLSPELAATLDADLRDWERRVMASGGEAFPDLSVVRASVRSLTDVC